MNRHRASSTMSVAFGDVDYPPGGEFGPRIQTDVQLVIVYAGEARIQVEETLLLVPSQHAVLLLPKRREQFQFARTRPTQHTWCALTPLLVPAPLLEKISQLPAGLPLTNRIHSLVEYGLAVPAGAAPASDALLEAIGLATLHAFVFEAELLRSTGDMPASVRQAQQFIEERLHSQLRLSEIAQAANITPQHLTRLFQRHLHTTPTRYLWQLRLRRGVELLGATGLSIGEIAERVGFQSPFHFSRMVRERYQFSPRELRARLWRGEPPDNHK